MRAFVVASLAVALVGCSSNADQIKEDTKPVAEVEAPEAQNSEAADSEAAQGGDAAVKTALEQAATGEHRSDANIARNQYRHPVETLSFFGIKPDMTVVEIWPGGGWYSEVLAPFLAADGKLIAASFAPKTDEPDHYTNRLYKGYEERIKNDPAFSKIELGMLQPGQEVAIGEPESADMVVTFRNIHSFMGQGVLDEIFAESYKVLKPGGILGVVEHRADESADPAESAKKGYVPTAYVIERAEAAGFELVEESEINANPKDTKDHEKGVWTLPPSLALGETDRAKYEAIGESDRMTLKFRKKAADAEQEVPAEPAAE